MARAQPPKRAENKTTVTVTMDLTDLATLDDAAGRYFGGYRTPFVTWAVRLAAAVLAEPAARANGITPADDTLAAFVAARGGRSGKGAP